MKETAKKSVKETAPTPRKKEKRNTHKKYCNNFR